MNQTDMQSTTGASFIRFAFFFWVGGFAIHYLSILLSLPATQHNFSRWWRLAARLFCFLFLAAIALFSVWLLSRAARCGFLALWLYFVLSLAVLAVGCYFSVRQVGLFHALLYELEQDGR